MNCCNTGEAEFQVGDRLVYNKAVCPAKEFRVGQKATVIHVNRGFIRIRWDDGREEGLISTNFSLISVTEIKRGGKREGSGRHKATDPTVVIRVPGSQVDRCREYAKFGFTSDQVLWAYCQCQLQDCHLTIPGLPVSLAKIYQFGFRWLGSFNHFKDSVVEMAHHRDDMEVVHHLELSIKFDW